MAVSNIEWKDVATVVEPAVAKCLNPGLREVAEEGGLDGGGRTFFVVRKRPEGAAVRIGAHLKIRSYTCRREPYSR